MFELHLSHVNSHSEQWSLAQKYLLFVWILPDCEPILKLYTVIVPGNTLKKCMSYLKK